MRPAVAGRLDPIAVGLLAFVVGVCGAGRPSLWLDDAATISASTRSLPELMDLLGHVDAVHGLYYVLMHWWFAIFPESEFWSRVPSSILVGGAAAGVVVLGRQLSTRALGLSAGVLFAVLPRTTWAAVEARSYALSMFDAVWITVLCVVAVRRARPWVWIAYAACLALAVVANVFVILVVAVHGVILWRAAASRRTRAAWLASVVAACTAVLPFLAVMKSQTAQVNWIWPVGPGTLGQVLGDQYFPAVIGKGAVVQSADRTHEVTPELVSVMLHAQALVAPVIVAVVVVALVAVRRVRRGTADRLPDGGARLVTWVGAVWVLVPTAVVIGYSLVSEPMYQPHYMAFTVPGLALLVGLAVVVVGGQPRRIAVVLLVIALTAVPNYLAQRGTYSKQGRDHSVVADLIARHAAAGDCLNVDVTAPQVVVEPLTAGRPSAFAKLRDPGRTATAVERDALFESRAPADEWAGVMGSCPALWTVTAKDGSLPDHESGERLAPGSRLAGVAAHRVPAELGFHIVERWQFSLTQVLHYVPTR